MVLGPIVRLETSPHSSGAGARTPRRPHRELGIAGTREVGLGNLRARRQSKSRTG
jgi:hypothetical protein